jgi:hypothetical protein
MSYTTNVQVTVRRFWVVGGKYETMAFDRLAEGTECVYGPFVSEEDAQSMWRSVNERTRCQATLRFTMAEEPPLTPAG